MPVAVSYPGVYVEEVSSGVRTITGVATSIAAFVDFFPKGPLGDDKNPVGHNAVRVFSFADFERQFGGLDTRSEASYAIQQFFLSGGNSAYVVRVSSATNASAAAVIDLGDGKTAFLEATAVSAGSWGNDLRIDVDYGTNDAVNAPFNLTVTQTAGAGSTQVVATEKFLNLINDPTKPNDASATVNAGSQLIRMKSLAAGTPSQSGTASAAITDLSTLALADKSSLTVSLGSSKVAAASIGATDPITPVPTTIAGLASALQAALRGIKKSNVAVMPNATVTVAGSASSNSYLVVDAGVVPSLNNGKYDSSAFVSFADATGNYQAKLAFAPNVQQYAVGGPNAQGATGGVAGDDGKWDFKNDADGIAAAIIGDQAKKSGIYSLLNVDLFNILCLPATMNLSDTAAHAVAADAIALCTDRRAMYILDAPQADKVRDNPTDIMAWLDANAGLRSRNAALYFPRFDIPDPLNKFRNRIVSPSGTMAGLYAATDANRGVWKAPAGTEAGLSGVTKLEYTLTDGENGVLNPLAINALRNFPVYGPVAWGARTLYGADQMADDYKYIPIRRLALFIEESLYRGTQWVVFEPNAAPLWAQVRLNVGAFMQNLFKQGAFFGTTPSDAYFVTCDATNNPANTINLGIINIAVGFAPIKPAEFVVIQIQQIAGQIAN